MDFSDLMKFNKEKWKVNAPGKEIMLSISTPYGPGIWKAACQKRASGT